MRMANSTLVGRSTSSQRRDQSVDGYESDNHKLKAKIQKLKFIAADRKTNMKTLLKMLNLKEKECESNKSALSSVKKVFEGKVTQLKKHFQETVKNTERQIDHQDHKLLNILKSVRVCRDEARLGISKTSKNLQEGANQEVERIQKNNRRLTNENGKLHEMVEAMEIEITSLREDIESEHREYQNMVQMREELKTMKQKESDIETELELKTSELDDLQHSKDLVTVNYQKRMQQVEKDYQDMASQMEEEFSRRMETFKNEASRASNLLTSNHESITDKLRLQIEGLETKLRHHQQNSDSLLSQKSKNEEIEKTVDRYSKQIEGLQSKIIDLNNDHTQELTEIESRLEVSENQVSQLTKKLKDGKKQLQKSLDLKEEEIEELKFEVDQAQRKAGRDKSRIAQLETQIDQLNQEVSSLQEEIVQHSVSLKSMKSDLQSRNQQSEEKVTEACQKYEGQMKSLHKDKSIEIQKLNIVLQKKSSDLNSATKKFEKLTARYSKLQKEQEETEVEMRQLIEVAQNKQGEVDSLTEKVSDLKMTEKVLNEELRKAENEIEGLSSQVDQLQGQLESEDTHKGNLKQQIDQKIKKTEVMASQLAEDNNELVLKIGLLEQEAGTKDNQIESLHQEYDRLVKEYEKSKKQTKQFEHEVQRLNIINNEKTQNMERDNREVLNDKVEEFLAEIKSKDKEIEELDFKFDGLQVEKQVLEKDCDDLRTKIRTQENTIENLNSQMEGVDQEESEQISELRSKLESSQSDLISQRQENDNLNRQISEISSSLKEAEREKELKEEALHNIKELKLEISRVKEEHKDYESRLQGEVELYKNNISEYESQIKEEQSQGDSLQEQSEHYQQKYKEATSQYEKLGFEFESLQEKMEDAISISKQERANKLATVQEEHSEEILKLEQVIQQQKVEINGLESKIADMETSMQKNDSEGMGNLQSQIDLLQIESQSKIQDLNSLNERLTQKISDLEDTLTNQEASHKEELEERHNQGKTSSQENENIMSMHKQKVKELEDIISKKTIEFDEKIDQIEQLEDEITKMEAQQQSTIDQTKEDPHIEVDSQSVQTIKELQQMISKLESELDEQEQATEEMMEDLIQEKKEIEEQLEIATKSAEKKSKKMKQLRNMFIEASGHSLEDSVSVTNLIETILKEYKAFHSGSASKNMGGEGQSEETSGLIDQIQKLETEKEQQKKDLSHTKSQLEHLKQKILDEDYATVADEEIVKIINSHLQVLGLEEVDSLSYKVISQIFEHEKERRESLEKEIEEIEKDASDLQGQLSNLQMDYDDLEIDYQDLQDTNQAPLNTEGEENLKRDLGEVEAQVQELQFNVETKERERKRAVHDLDQEKDKLKVMEGELNILKESRDEKQGFLKSHLKTAVQNFLQASIQGKE